MQRRSMEPFEGIAMYCMRILLDKMKTRTSPLNSMPAYSGLWARSTLSKSRRDEGGFHIGPPFLTSSAGSPMSAAASGVYLLGVLARIQWPSQSGGSKAKTAAEESNSLSTTAPDLVWTERIILEWTYMLLCPNGVDA